MKEICIGMIAAAVGCAFVLAAASAGDAANEKVLYSFCSQQNCPDGGYPTASLINVNGTLYGTAEVGGEANLYGGVVFSFSPATGAETVVYSFCSQQNCTDGNDPVGSLLDVKGMLYGTTNYGGANPTSNLINVNGTLYGTTAHGGANCPNNGGCGTVFSLDRNTGGEKVLYSFCNKQHCTDGQNPGAGLTHVNGALYGTTIFGGDANQYGGVVFAVDLSSGTETVLHAFGGGTDGAMPLAGLIDAAGVLYGTTSEGGANCKSDGGCGTVFSLDPNTGAESVIYSFCGRRHCADGSAPNSVIDVKGVLYGTTDFGGSSCQNVGGCGTAFSLDPSTGVETRLYSFCGQADCTDGADPDGLINVKGTLYGVTPNGGAYQGGTVFAVKRP